MRKNESQCVDCGLPCIGSKCPNYAATVVYCDNCGWAGAEYQVDDLDLCEDCLGDYLEETFKNMTISERVLACGKEVEKI